MIGTSRKGNLLREQTGGASLWGELSKIILELLSENLLSQGEYEKPVHTVICEIK